MKNLIEKSKENIEFQEIIKDIIENEEFQKTKNFKSHKNKTIFSHCYKVSYLCYLVCKKRNLDYKSATRGALLHDFYLYEWRQKGSHKRPHAWTHPKVALENSQKNFLINNLEKDMILTHMWPIAFFTLPLYRESWILTIIDKQCAISEIFS